MRHKTIEWSMLRAKVMPRRTKVDASSWYVGFKSRSVYTARDKAIHAGQDMGQVRG